MKSLRALAKSTFVYGLGDILLFGISYLVMIPLLTRFLSPEEYGVVATLNTISVFLLALFQFGLPSAAFRYWFQHTNSVQQKSYMSSMMLTTIALMAVLAFGMLLLGRPIWESWITLASFDEYASYIIIGAVLQVIIAYKSVLLRALDRPRLFITLDICQFLTMLFAVAYQVVVLHNGVIGQVRGVFYTQVVFAAVSFGVIISICGIRFNADGLTRSFRFAWPVMMGGLVSLIATRSTILITQHFVTGVAVGLFALGSQIGLLVQMAASSLEKAWQPYLYSNNPDDASKSLRSLLTFAAPVYSLVALSLALFSPEIIGVLASRTYAGASVIANIALLGSLCMALSSIVNGGLYYATRSGLSLLVTSAAAATNVLLCWILIPHYGIVGAAVATAIAGVVSLTLMITSIRAVFDAHIKYGSVIWSVLFGLVLAWLTNELCDWFTVFSSVGLWTIKLTAIGVYIVVTWKMKWYDGLRLSDNYEESKGTQLIPTGIAEVERQ